MSVVIGLEPVSATRVGEQAAKTLIIVVALLVGFRLAGKRQLGQFNVYDLAMIMALSNGVQNAMTGGLGNLEVGLATSTTVVGAAWAVSRVLARRAPVEARVLGSPTVLVNDGRVLTGRLRRERVSPAELDEACREHGVERPEDCHLVVLEVDGSLSVVPGTAVRTPEPVRRRRRPRTRRP